MQKAIITGGAGFIGSHLSKKLLNKGLKVYCIDNLLTSSEENIAEIKSNSNFKFIKFDIINPMDDISSKIKDVDFVFHMASPASPNPNSPRSFINLPLETMMVNSIGTYHALKLAKEKNAKFLLASTSECYGNPNVSPQPETYFGNVNPNGPRSVYDEAKRFAEAMTFSFLRNKDLDARIIRIFNTYGPFMQKDDGRVVSNFINQALEDKSITIYGDGSQTRSFCHVDDMTDGIIAAMTKHNTKGEVINLGNPDERKISEIAKIIKKITKSSSNIVFEDRPSDDPDRRKPDISKAKKLLSWSPKVDLLEGLGKTVEYFKNS